MTAGKPDPEGYRRALEALNAVPPLPERLLHPHEVLAVEDSPAGLIAAGAAGLVTLGIARDYLPGLPGLPGFSAVPEPAGLAGPGGRRQADAVIGGLEGLTLERLDRLFAEASRR